MSQYKITKKRLAEIIKEEYQSLQHRKTRRLNEDASDDTFEMVDAIINHFAQAGDVRNPHKQALEELVQAMERSKAHELLGFIMQNYEIRMPGDEVEEYDPSAYNRKDEAKEAKKDFDGDGKKESSKKEWEGSRDKAIKKAVKKESLDSIRDLITQELNNL